MRKDEPSTRNRHGLGDHRYLQVPNIMRKDEPSTRKKCRLRDHCYFQVPNIMRKDEPSTRKKCSLRDHCYFQVPNIMRKDEPSTRNKHGLGDVVVVVDPTPPTCCQQSPAPEIMWQPAVSPPRWQGKAPLCRDSSRGPG